MPKSEMGGTVMDMSTHLDLGYTNMGRTRKHKFVMRLEK